MGVCTRLDFVRRRAKHTLGESSCSHVRQAQPRPRTRHWMTDGRYSNKQDDRPGRGVCRFQPHTSTTQRLPVDTYTAREQIIQCSLQTFFPAAACLEEADQGAPTPTAFRHHDLHRSGLAFSAIVAKSSQHRKHMLPCLLHGPRRCDLMVLVTMRCFLR